MTDRERDDLLLSMANDIRDIKERLTTVDHRMGKVEHAVSHTLPIQIDSLENSLLDLRRA